MELDHSPAHKPDLPLAVKNRLLVELNQTGSDFPRDQLIHQLFEKQAHQTPEATALVFQTQQLSYQQLNHQANQLAHYLHHLGVGPETLVGICVERSIEMIVGLLGTLKVGGTYVPLDPTYPKERLAFMLEDARPPVLLSQESLVSRLPNHEAVVIRLDADWPRIAAQPLTNLTCDLSSKAVAYAIYTSGSTGKPKGVLGTHIGAVNRFFWMWQTYPFSSDEVCCQKTTLSFGDSVWEIFGPLLQGLPLVIIPDDTVKDSIRLVQALADHKISRIVLVPSLLQVILESVDRLEQRLPHLKYWTTSGETLSVALCRQFKEALPKAVLLNIYGSSEVAADVTWFDTSQQDIKDTVPIGRPIANMQTYVLGQNLELLPPGAVGELYVGGVGLAKGYLHRPELTAERFIPHPFDHSPEARLFKTGDIARYLPDNNLEFLGRADHQVKIRGIRIELGEIETVLGRHPAIDQVIAQAWDAAGGQKRLVAYVVLKPQATITDNSLREFVGRHLPDPMVPAAFVRLEAFPLTPNGKIDRHALPEPKRIRPILSHAFVPPQTPLEEEITAIWAEVLGFTEIGREDNFFDLGGDSLLGSQLGARLSQKFRREFLVQDLFERPTVAALAEFLTQAEAPRETTTLMVERVDRRQDLLLSLGQESLWFLAQLDPDSSAYNIPLAVEMKGELDVSALTKSLELVVQHHESLRTRFEIRQGKPVQVIEPEPTVPLQIINLVATKTPDQEPELADILRREAAAPFNLTQGPLLRVRLIRLGSQRNVLLVVIHHLMADDWSLRLFMKELWHLYDAYVRGVAPRLSAPAIQYVDFAVWQRTALTSEALDQDVAYWKEQLADLPPLLELPADHRRVARRRRRAGAEVSHFSAALMGSLKTLSRRSEATLYLTLLAAFQTLLYRYTGQDDLVVGTPVTRRPCPEFEGIIGYFVNTLVLRLDLSGNPTFQQLLGRAREMVLGALSHQRLPFERLVQELQPERALDRNPLFQVMFAYQNEPSVDDLKPTGLNIKAHPLNTGTAMFDLVLFLEETPQGLNLVWDYDADLFEAETIGRLVAHFEQLVTALAFDANRPLLRLPLLIEAERRQLLVEWNQTAMPFPKDRCFHQLFEAQVSQTPAALALVYGAETQTYDSLNRRANQLAYYLRRKGVGPEVLVGICLERSPDLIVALLAVLKAGGAYVPLDPGYPVDRLNFMIDDAKLPVLITQEHLATGLSATSGQRVCLNKEWSQVARGPDENLENQTRPDNLAYVIYTSGSTGRPKGVLIEHQGLSNLAWAQIKAFEVQANSRVLQFASFSFDAAISEVAMTLLAGATLYLADQHQLMPGSDLVKVLRDQAISVVTLPPSVLAVLSPEQFPDLRTVVSAGEACSAEIVVRWAPGRRFLNAYGPAENTVCATLAHCRAGSRKPPIGKPIDNVQIYILNEALEPAPIGVTGEIYIGGLGLARGYLNRPDLTAERFIEVDKFPFESHCADLRVYHKNPRLYRTGDLARYLPDGTIEYVGRIDRQIKLRGFRIELEEIEAVLKSHPEVQDGVVDVREVQGNTLLFGYLTARSQPAPTASELHRFLRQTLPEHMIPSVYVMLEQLPLTPNGKIDRQALPAPDQARPDLTTAYVAPRTPTEQEVARVWAEVVRLERVGVHDSFFELGGHSLLAVQVIARLEQRFEVELGVRPIFENPTVAGLAAAIETQIGVGCALPLAPIQRDSQLPLSFAQERLWFLEQLETHNAAYNIGVALWLQGDLDPTALGRSINALVARHEVLRTRFVQVEGRPAQIVGADRQPALSVVDLTPLDEDQREVEANQLARNEISAPFDLTDDSLLRVKLVRLEAARHLLMVTMHHIISDQWSVRVFLEELSRLYGEAIGHEAANLAELSVQYADYAAWQRQWLHGEVLARQLDYWKQQLGGELPVLELPTDRPRPAVQRYQGASESLLLPPELLTKLSTIGQSAGATPFMTLLVAFQILLYRYSGQDDILIGTPIANRGRAELENLMGLFLNTLVVRVDLSGNPTFKQLLGHVRQVALDAFSHKDLPFERLVEVLQPERDLSRNPLFQVMFVYQSEQVAPKLKLPGISVQPLEVPTQTAKFDLTLFVEQTADGLKCLLEYNSDIFEAETIRRMLDHFRVLLQGAVADPNQRIGFLPLLTAAEQKQILFDWNDTLAEIPDLCVHKLFEAQVERTPEAIAVVWADTGTGSIPDRPLTYRELNRRANQLAHHLRTLGVEPDTLVGLYLTRSVEMIVGILAVLKAGGAYVPLEPELPPERLAFQLEDAQIKVLLTETTLQSNVSDCSASLLCLDTDWDSIADQPGDNPEINVSPEHLVYVIYTSGSTGKPKGVLIHHRGVVNYLLWAVRAYEVDQGAGAPLHASFAFDMTVTSIFGPLLSGRTVYLLPDNLGVAGLGEAMRRHTGFSLVKVTPTHLELLSRQLAGLDIADRTRYLVLGGENLLAQQVTPWRVLAPETVLVNEYGPTETVVGCCAYITPPAELGSASVPIGRPIANTQLYILDKNLQPTPIGVTGELYIGGVGVARGYLNRPELTAERFILNSFTSKGTTDPRISSRLFRSGDLARYRPDGNIEYLGRIDHQVKIRGYRVELEEIETVLREHAALREAVVLAEGTSHNTRLAAFVVAKEGVDPPTASELQAYLRSKLPDYMQPPVFVLVERIPQAASGKADRKVLEAMLKSGIELKRAFFGPRNDIEQRLLDIWEAVLEIRPVGVRDNFFQLGGHSLLAIRLITEIETAFQVKIPLVTLFQDATVEHLATLIQKRDSLNDWSSLVALQPEGHKPPFFCVHGITGDVLWFAELARLLGRDRPFYGLQARGLDGQQPPFDQIEAMAAYYIDQIRQIQPEGPYYLGGASFGGNVAYEMAQQLQSKGEQIALLVMFDNAPANLQVTLEDDNRSPTKLKTAVRLLGNVSYRLNDLTKRNPAEIWARIQRELRVATKEAARRFNPDNQELLHVDANDIIDYAAQLPEYRCRLIEVHYQAMKNYYPQPYPGSMTIIKAHGRPIFDANEPEAGWRTLVLGPIDVATVPGSHEGMFREPHVQDLARALRVSLEKAET
jgi:amino acid adenylation domain-containing protein